jgi:hypothetical protein
MYIWRRERERERERERLRSVRREVVHGVIKEVGTAESQWCKFWSKDRRREWSSCTARQRATSLLAFVVFWPSGVGGCPPLRG